MKTLGKRLGAALLAAAMTVSLTGCQRAGMNSAVELTAEFPPKTEENIPALTPEQAELLTDFGLRLAWGSMSGSGNGLISPMSAVTALGMTANGAGGETLKEMEGTLGAAPGELNRALYAYWRDLPQGEEGRLHPANSIWFKDDEKFTVERDFLQTVSDFYGAQIYKAPMDRGTCEALNGWVREHTHGMIPGIVDEIPEETVMYLVNALAFEGEWPKLYEEYQVSDGIFLTDSGYPVKTELMGSEEYTFLENEWVTGVMKYYKGGEYAFVGLLPKDGMSLMAALDALDGESLQKLLRSPIDVPVATIIPKFETEYKLDLREPLQDMGMERAFDKDLADFSVLGRHQEGNIYIDKVLHRTFLTMGEKGTRAGAVTAVAADAESCAPEQREVKEVFLDRPFLYLLIDTKTCVPFFIGTMNDPTGEAPEPLAGGPGLTVRIGGRLYASTGREESELFCGTPDGVISSSVPFGEAPAKDDQSNFGSGWNYQRSGSGFTLMLGRHRVLFEEIK